MLLKYEFVAIHKFTKTNPLGHGETKGDKISSVINVKKIQTVLVRGRASNLLL